MPVCRLRLLREIFTQQTQAPANRNARSKQWQPWVAACQRKRLRFLRFSFTQHTQRKRLRLSGIRTSVYRQYLSCDDCLEDKKEVYQNCSVLCTTVVPNHMHTHMSNSYRWTIGLVFGLVSFCVCFYDFFLTRITLFVKVSCLCFVYYLFVLWLPVPAQSIAWKGSSPKWPVMCRVVGWLSGRTSVSDRRTFTGVHRTCSWRVTIYMGKPSAVGQPTRPTQPFILTGSINE